MNKIYRHIWSRTLGRVIVVPECAKGDGGKKVGRRRWRHVGLVAPVLLLQLPNDAFADTNWTGGGGNFNWNNAANWSNGVPDGNGISYIDNGIAQPVTVNGTNSLLNEFTTVGTGITGLGNQGSIWVGNGGTLTGSYLTLATSPTGVANVNVNGQNSSLTVNGLTVGHRGTAHLIVGNGAVVNGGVTIVGGYSSANGTITVSAATYNSSGHMLIGGNDGSGTTQATLNIFDNGVVRVNGGTGDLIVAGPPNSTATVNIGDDGGFAGNLDAGALRFGDGNGTLNFNHSTANYNFLVPISGTGTVNNIAGTTIFGAANTYAGETRIQAGEIRAGVAGAFSESSTFVVEGGTLNLNNIDQTIAGLAGTGGTVSLGTASLTVDQAGNTTYAGTITGAGSLIKDGAGVLTLTGANSYLGGTTITAGTLVGNTTSLQGAIVNNAALVFDQAANGTYSGIISGSGTLTKEGAGVLTLTGANSYLGGTTITAGTLIGNTTSLQGDIANNAALVFDQAANGTYAGIISGSGTLTKDGVGVLTLTGANSYLGGTTITAGTLIGNTTSLQGAIVNNAALVFDQAANGTYAGIISGSGTLTKDGVGVLTLTGANSYLGGTTITAGTLIGNTTSLQGAIVNNAALVFDQAANGTYAGIISGSGTLTKEGTGVLTLTGANSYLGGTTITAGTLIGNTTSLQGAIVNNAALVFDQAANGTYAGIISGSGTLTKDGVGVLTLTGANSYLGGTTITAGTLIGNTTSLQGAIVNNAALVFDQAANGTYVGAISGSGTLTKDGAGVLTLTGANSYLGGTTITAGTLIGNTTSLQGAIVNNAALVFDQAANGTYAGIISGSGTLTKEGTGILTLTGANSYLGGTTITAGTLIGNTTSLQGAIANNAALVFDQAANGTYAGIISGSGTLTKQGASVLTLTGANSYLGETRLQAGELQAGVSGAFSTSSTFVVDGGTLNLNNIGQTIAGLAGTGGTVSLGTASLTVDQAGNTTYAGTITGAGSLIKDGTGVLTLTGANSYLGGTTITAGTLVGNTTSLQGAIANNAALVFDQAANGTYAGAISGSGALTKDGVGVLTLTGANSYLGGTTITAGTLIGNTTSLQGAIVNNAALVFDQAANGTYAGIISGSGTLTKQGAGDLTLSGNSAAFAGAATVSGGSLTVNGHLGGSLNVDGGTLRGSGFLGDVVLDSGATLAPGNSVGTMNVTNYTFNTGSIYEVELKEGGVVAGVDNDWLNASDAVTINGGAVHVTAENGLDDGSTYGLGTYTIVTAANGVTGAFDTLTDDFSFLDFSLSYGANDVFLTTSLTTTGFCVDGMSANQCAAGDGVFSLGAGSLFMAVLNLTDAEAHGALDGLSGEIHASVQTGLIEDSRFAREAATERLRIARDGAAADPHGMAERRINDGFAFWGQAVGAWGSWDGHGGSAEMDRSTGGLFLGGDARIADNARLGLFGGYTDSNFDQDDIDSSASATSWYMGAYAGGEWNGLFLSAGAVHGWHDIETSRGVSFTGFSDSLSDSYDARTMQVFGEAAYSFGFGAARFEPFANLAYVHLSADDYSESGGAAALTGDDSDMDPTFTTIGLRAAGAFDLGEMAARLSGSAGWRHAFGDVTPFARHALDGGGSFSAVGVPVARDALVLDLGTAIDLTSRSTFGVSYGGQFGSGFADHNLKASLSVGF